VHYDRGFSQFSVSSDIIAFVICYFLHSFLRVIRFFVRDDYPVRCAALRCIRMICKTADIARQFATVPAYGLVNRYL
jgi:hypothetical protein